MIKAGEMFPAFELCDQNGKQITLEQLNGKWVVFYVYPKDDTPGCTIEGKQFSASKSDFDELNTKIYGISADGIESHKEFCNKYSFSVDLLADPEAKLLNSLGVEQSEYKGTMYWNRVSFIVNPEGKVVKVYEKVTPDGHNSEVLKDLKQLQSQPVA